MTREDYVFIANVVVIDPMWMTMALSVISWPTSVTMKLNAIVKIRKYKGFMRGTILFQLPWRCTTPLGMIWIVSLKSVLVFCMIDTQKVIYPCLFAFNFSNNMLVLLFSML